MSVGTGRQNIIIQFWKKQFHFWEYINGNQPFILDSHRSFICSVLFKRQAGLCRVTTAYRANVHKGNFTVPKYISENLVAKPGSQLPKQVFLERHWENPPGMPPRPVRLGI
jgi:hypothetical protein